MCATCVDVIRQYWPDVQPETNLGIGSKAHPAAEILWDCTAFPFCGPDQLDEQLAEFFYYAALHISQCAFCGRPGSPGDGKVHIGAGCQYFGGRGHGCDVMDEVLAMVDKAHE